MDCAGCNLITSQQVRLVDGREVCSSCPAWRHETEARWVLERPSTIERRQYLDEVERKRGKPAADALRATLLALWEKRKAAREAAGAGVAAG